MAKTIKVRIAVAVDAEGTWGCAGWSGAQGNDLHDFADESCKNGEARYWIEAELPLPEEVTVQGTVTKADGQ